MLSMKEGLCLSQQACDGMVSGVSELFGTLILNLHQRVKSVCETAENFRVAIDETFDDELYVKPFTELSTRYHQLKYFREKFDLLVCVLLYDSTLLWLIQGSVI